MTNESHLLIILVSDETYLHYIKTLILSIKSNCLNPSEYLHFYLHLINVKTNHPIITWLTQQSAEFNLKYYIYHDNRKLSEVIPQNVPWKSEKISYCCNARITTIHNLLSAKQYKYLLYIDVDSIILNDLRPLFTLIKSCELTFYIDHLAPIPKKKPKWPTPRTKSGVIGITNMPITRQFFNDFNTKMIETKYLVWGLDQQFLEKLHKTYKNKLKYVELPKKYIDWDFDKSSIIWVGKGNRKSTNQKYIQMEKTINKV